MSPSETIGQAALPDRIRLVIADDHEVVREGLAAMIGRQDDMQVVGRAADGQAALALWKAHAPDVCLFDLRMPLLDGVGAIEAIRSIAPSARVIVLTTFDTDNDIARAIGAGARAYLLKDAPREVLLDCIRRVHAGEICIAESLVGKLAASISGERLTAREAQVLGFLAQGASNKEIGVHLHISEATVKTHLRSVFAKLNVISRIEAMAVASRRGLVRM